MQSGTVHIHSFNHVKPFKSIVGSYDNVVVKRSHLLDLTSPNCELRDRLQCVILLCFVYCAVVLIYYSGVLNKVSSYTALVESCFDSLQRFIYVVNVASTC